MFRYSWTLFRVYGIPIKVDLSWLIILALLTWSLADRFAAGFTARTEEAMPTGTALILGLLTAVAFFVCIVLHELGHAIVAKRSGIPIRGITLFMFGGVAQMESEPPSAAKEFWMAIAGPLVSVVLAALFWALTVAGINAAWDPVAVDVFQSLALINTAVLVFNMVPAFPLDGGRVLRSAIWAATGNLRRATWWAALCGQVFAWFLIGFALLILFSGQPGAFVPALWLGLIGMFLMNAAQASYQQVVIRQALKDEPIRRFMNTQPITVPPSISLREWVEDYVYTHHHKTYPVVRDGQLEGCISTRALGDLPRGEWDRRTVGEAMCTDVADISIPPDADALHAFERMQRTGSSRLLVIENGHLAGILSLKDLLKFLQLKMELENGEGGDEQPRAMWPRHQREETHVRAQ